MNNIAIVNAMIDLKKGYEPFHATDNIAKSIITDFSVFPYDRFYRGKYDAPYPVVIEREAGHSSQLKRCYTPEYVRDDKCVFYEHPCSTTVRKYCCSSSSPSMKCCV